jgi:hypothetical protein
MWRKFCIKARFVADGQARNANCPIGTAYRLIRSDQPYEFHQIPGSLINSGPVTDQKGDKPQFSEGFLLYQNTTHQTSSRSVPYVSYHSSAPR